MKESRTELFREKTGETTSLLVPGLLKGIGSGLRRLEVKGGGGPSKKKKADEPF